MVGAKRSFHRKAIVSCILELLFVAAAVGQPNLSKRDYYIPADPDGSELNLCPNLNSTQDGPVIASNGRDRLVIVWVTRPVLPYDAPESLYYRVIYLGDPPCWPAPRRVHGPFIPSGTRFVHHVHPSVAMRPWSADPEAEPDHSGFVIVWETRTIDPIEQPPVLGVAVSLNRYDRDGNPVSGTVVESAPIQDLASPVVGIDADGTHVVIWKPLRLPDQGQPGYEELVGSRLTGIAYRWDDSVYIPRFRVDKEFECEIGIKGDLRDPNVSLDPSGVFGVSWNRSECQQAVGPYGLRGFRMVTQPVPRVVKSDQADHPWERTSQRVGYDPMANTAIGFMVGEKEDVDPYGVGVFAAEYEIHFNQDTDSSGEPDISVAQFTCPVHNERVEPGYMFSSVDT